MNKSYLIPANTKKGLLIFNLFTPFDLILFLTGVGISFLLLVVFGTDNVIATFLVMLPGLVCAFLVLPVPNYHNVLTFFMSVINFLSNQRIYKWRGWCFHESNKD